MKNEDAKTAGTPEERETPPPRKSRVKRFFTHMAIWCALFAAIFWLTPVALTLINIPELEFDLADSLKALPPGLVKNTKATAKIDISRGDGAYLIRADGRILDWAYSGLAHVKLAWRWFGVDATGGFALRIKGSRLGLTGEYAASSSGEWSADVRMPKTRLDEREQVFATLLARLKTPGVENIRFSGDAEMTAHAEQTKALGVPSWNAKVRFTGLDIACTASGNDIEIADLGAGVGAAGIGDHVDLSPIFIHTTSLSAAGFTLSKAFASIRATETALLVTEAGGTFCGGDIRLYSLFLDPAKLNAGVTIFVDGVDAGELMKHFKDFRGDATGRLYGKIPLRLKDGKTLRLSNAYLHSAPGETGSLRISDPEPIVDNLALAGIDKATRDNFASALANLSYSVLKITLTPEDDGKMALGLKIEGTATRGNTTVPVSFEVTFHGDIEELLNTGLGIMAKGS